jgi:uncharacterized membrane protein
MAAGETDQKGPSLLIPWRVLVAHYRLALCGALGAAAGLALPDLSTAPFTALPPTGEITPVTRSLFGWNVAVLLYLYAAARIVAHATRDSIRLRARETDEGRGAVLFLTATATFAALGALIAELGHAKNLFPDEKTAHIALAVTTVFTSWAFMHLIFAFHYAHEFYSADNGDARGGLRFPGTPEPQYPDFLYFSYVIGVACQTADVELTTQEMRKVALAHGVVAFFFNTTILALMVNIASQFV